MPPFSTKRKKEQLQKKRQQKREREDDPKSFYRNIVHKTTFSGRNMVKSQTQQKDNKQADANSRKERFADLQFFKDDEEEIKRRKEQAVIPIVRLGEVDREVRADCEAASLDMPKRPSWNKDFTKEQLDRHEQIYFKNFVDKLLGDAKAADKKLSYFDLNLETWRQLWRVLEMSEILTIIVDIRHPLFHFPPTLYHHIVNELKKMVIIVLNKVDLVSSQLVLAWQDYLKNQYPEVRVIPFASYAGMKAKKDGRRFGLLHMATDGAQRFLNQVEELIGPDKFDFSSWREKIANELSEKDSAEKGSPDRYSDRDSQDGDSPDEHSEKDEDCNEIEENLDKLKLKNSKLLTIGCVGHPNVGKSSFMNALIGKKLVSVSRTPGHTKHFQTIFLTENVRLCDCPGLVFPSYYPKQLQVLMGCYPISQLREPYSSITYLAERLDLPKILKLQLIDEAGNLLRRKQSDAEMTWSAFSICESWALFKGFLTAKSGRPDVYRAANHLLRMALDGRTLCLSFFTPDYTKNKNKYDSDERLTEIERIQGKHNIVREEDDGY